MWFLRNSISSTCLRKQIALYSIFNTLFILSTEIGYASWIWQTRSWRRILNSRYKSCDFQAKPSQAKPSQAKPSQAKPSQAKPSQAKPSQAKPSRAEPSRAKPSQAEPSQAEPSRAKPSRAKPKCSLGEETCAKRKSKSPCFLAIRAFDRVAGLCNRHLNSNRGICLC
jgi:caspase recruitment domain-containing protein 6